MELQKTYLMSNEQGFIKIGKSNSPILRESNLKVGDPSIELLAICDKDVEAILHMKYKHYRHKGEWFKLSTKQILKIISDFNFNNIVEDKIFTIDKDKVEDVEEINPFIKNLTIESGRKIVDYGKYSQNRAEYDKNKNIPLTYLERANKISLYTSPIIRQVLCNLSGSSLKLLIWIQQSMSYGRDDIKFNAKRFLKETGMSPSTLVIAKKGLIVNQIIAEKKSDKKSFWINPVIMFKGSRTKKYPDNILTPIGGNTTSDSKIN